MDDLEYRWRGDAADFATCMTVAAQGNVVAVGNGAGGVTAFDARTGALRFGREVNTGGVLALDAYEGVIVSGGNDGKAHFIDAETGAEKAVLEATFAEGRKARAWIEHIAFSPSGAFVAIAAGKTLCFTDRHGALLHRIDAAPSTIAGVSWNRKSSELAIAAYGGLRTYRPTSGERAKYLSWKGSLIAIAWSPDEKVVACGTQDCAVHFWRLTTTNDSEMSGYPSKPKSLSWDASGGQLATSGDASACVWNFTGKGPEGTSPVQLAGHGKPITQVLFHPKKGLLATASQDGSIFVWEPKKTKKPLAFASMPAEVTALAWLPNGDLVACDGEGGVACFAVNA